MAHHETKARKALDETAEFAKAIEAALMMVDPLNTLIVVTADHSHTMTYSGYNKRGSDILGLSKVRTNFDTKGFVYNIIVYKGVTFSQNSLI